MRLPASIVRGACSLLLIAWVSPALAGFEATPFLGYRAGGELEDEGALQQAELDEDASFGLAFNLDQTGYTQWELYLGRQRTSLQSDVPFAGEERFDLEVDYYHLGGTYLFSGEQVRPYIVATLGATRLEPGPAALGAETRFSMALGVGVRYLPSAHFGLRAEVRGFGTLFDDDTELFCGSIDGVGVCAIEVAGSVMIQVEAWTGILFRF